MPYLDKNGLIHLWSKVKSALAKKQGNLTPENGVYIRGAEIGLDTPIRVLTQSEYNALSAEKKSSGLSFVSPDDEDGEIAVYLNGEVLGLITQEQLDDALSGKVSKTGDVMSGDLTVQKSPFEYTRIAGDSIKTGNTVLESDRLMFNRTQDEDTYVDGVALINDDGQLILARSSNDPDTTGDVVISGVATPLHDNEATNKSYVDGAIPGAGDGLVKANNKFSVEIPVRDLTEEEYEALSDEEKENGLIFLPDDGEDSGGGSTGGSTGGGNIPSGGIIMWFGYVETIPSGWALCDGDNGTPDLRGRFVLGPSASHPIGETGGSETVTLTVEQMPSHNHQVDSVPIGNGNYTVKSLYEYVNRVSVTSVSRTTNTGSSQPHPNMPPYYVLAFIMKL